MCSLHAHCSPGRWSSYLQHLPACSLDLVAKCVLLSVPCHCLKIWQPWNLFFLPSCSLSELLIQQALPVALLRSCRDGMGAVQCGDTGCVVQCETPQTTFTTKKGRRRFHYDYNEKKLRSIQEHPSWSWLRGYQSGAVLRRLCHHLVDARSFSVAPLPGSRPNQTQSYDLNHVIEPKLLSAKVVSWHWQVQCTAGSSNWQDAIARYAKAIASIIPYLSLQFPRAAFFSLTPT